MTISDYISRINTEEGAEALSALCLQAKSSQGREEINRNLPYELICLASHDKIPKKRKNAYRLIGLLKNRSFLPLLQEALFEENTLFAIPSILLSLGALGDYDSIEKYIPPVSENNTMDKHVAEIALARKKALQSKHKEDLPNICLLPKPKSILCFAPEGFNPILGEELRSLGFAVVQEKKWCRVSTSDLYTLFKANCLVEVLIPVQKNVPLDTQRILKALPDIPKEPYRIELRGYTKDRRKLINSLSAVLGGDNNPSNYSWELRIDCREEYADLYWKPCMVQDERYPWRKHVLPASINPALASCLANYVKKLCSVSSPSVLDPFCGCGSLLFSLESVMHCRILMGVDKSSNAIECARDNALTVKSRAFFVTKDILRFESKTRFDIVISNMPFGLRVGNHNYNMDLYIKFLKRLPRFLSENGFAMLYTMEYKLLYKCIMQTPGLKIRDTVRTAAGGLLPWIFVIDKE